jgi:APA family basic amino acid/polyamine antiporter
MSQQAPTAPPPESRLVGLRTATFIVVANMIGTGVFTSLGFQAAAIDSAFVLLGLWVVGGVYALCGALCYGELAAAMPRSGGEYHLLSRIYHPAVGFLAGWVSVTVGFAAPIAAAAMALGKYASRVLPGLSPTLTALTVAVAVSLVHLFSFRIRKGFQDLATLFKLLLIIGLILSGLALAAPQPVAWAPRPADLSEFLSAPFAVSLVYVTYSYSGWNAAVYLAGEIKHPARNIPRSLLLGTLIVTALYLLLNFAFLYTTPTSVLAGQVEVGYLAAGYIFGQQGARIMGLLISVGLVSAISSMVWAGPRVLLVVGEDLRSFRPLAPLNAHRVPQRAVLLQLAIVLTLILTSTFEQVITYLGFTLAMSTFLAVLGVFVHRARDPDAARPYRTWAYPVTPLVFLSITGWMLVYLLRHRPFESLAGVATLALGLGVYFVTARR